MPIARRKIRLVIFRLAGEEYQLLSDVCTSTGSRSISDFTRNAVISHSRLATAPRGLLSEDLATISLELCELDAELKQVSSRIERVIGSAAHRQTAGGS